MTSDNWLLVFVVGVIMLAVWLWLTNPNTPEETKKMLEEAQNSEDMFP